MSYLTYRTSIPGRRIDLGWGNLFGAHTCERTTAIPLGNRSATATITDIACEGAYIAHERTHELEHSRKTQNQRAPYAVVALGGNPLMHRYRLARVGWGGEDGSA
jgi:hypothetical protein